MFTLSDTTNNSPNKWNFVFLLAQPPMSPVLRALASPKGLKGKNPRPSAAVRRILGARKTPPTLSERSSVCEFVATFCFEYMYIYIEKYQTGLEHARPLGEGRRIIIIIYGLLFITYCLLFIFRQFG